MTEQQETTYSKIIGRALLKLIQWRNGSWWFVDSEDNTPVHGPFISEDVAKEFLISYEGSGNE